MRSANSRKSAPSAGISTCTRRRFRHVELPEVRDGREIRNSNVEGRRGDDPEEPNLTLPDSRRIPARPGRSEIRERASRFLGFAFRADDEASARERVAALSREFHDATHVCFAWRIGPSVRAADAGEPAGTAGKPMLAAIDALGLDCAAVAVVRYFGGTKLGTSGLVRCYRAAAREALEDAGAEQVFDTVEIEIDVPYDRVAQVKRAIEPPEIALIEETFSDRAHFRLAVRTGRVAALERNFEEWRIPFRRTGDS